MPPLASPPLTAADPTNALLLLLRRAARTHSVTFASIRNFDLDAQIKSGTHVCRIQTQTRSMCERERVCVCVCAYMCMRVHVCVCRCVYGCVHETVGHKALDLRGTGAGTWCGDGALAVGTLCGALRLLHANNASSWHQVPVCLALTPRHLFLSCGIIV